MKRNLLMITLLTLLLASCGGGMLGFDDAVARFEREGFTLEPIEVDPGRCYGYSPETEASIEYWTLICSEETEVDVITYVIGAAQIEQGSSIIRDQLNMIGFPYTEEVIDYLETNIAMFITGNREEEEIEDWIIAGWLEVENNNQYIYLTIVNERALDLTLW